MKARWSHLLLLAALVAATSVRAQEGPAYRVIVHPQNPIATVESRWLANAFLKKTVRWPDGEPILPVDLDTSSPARRRFTERVLNRSVPAVKRYWQQLVFSGRALPPPELDGDAAVVRYVLGHRGAVGYVSGGADLGGAKVLTVH